MTANRNLLMSLWHQVSPKRCYLMFDLVDEVQDNSSASEYITKITFRGYDLCHLETPQMHRGKSEHTRMVMKCQDCCMMRDRNAYNETKSSYRWNISAAVSSKRDWMLSKGKASTLWMYTLIHTLITIKISVGECRISEWIWRNGLRMCHRI